MAEEKEENKTTGPETAADTTEEKVGTNKAKDDKHEVEEIKTEDVKMNGEATKENGQVDGKESQKSVKKEGEEKPKTEEELKEVPYVPRPKKEEKEEKLAQIEEKMNEVRKVRAKHEKELQALRTKNEPEKKQLEQVREELTALNKNRDKLLKERDVLRSKADALKQAQKNRKDEIRKFKDKNRFTKTEDIDAEIQRLVQKQNTVSLSLKDEKNLIKDIESLKADRKKVEEFMQFLSGQSSPEANGESISEALKAKNSEIHVLFEQINILVNDRRKLLEKRDKDGNSYKSVRGKLQKTRDQLNALYDQKKAVYKEWKEKNDAWYDYHRAQQELKRQREQQQREEEKKMMEELREKREQEELKKKPWEEEIALCDFLINYLQRLLRESPDKKETADSIDAESDKDMTKALDGFEGMKLVQKKKEVEDNFMVMGRAKKGKGKKKKKKKEGEGVIPHSLDVLGSFGLLSLSAPMKHSEIPDAVKALEDKRAYYDVLPRAPKKPANESEEVEEGAKGTRKPKKPSKTKKKKVTAPSVESSDLFPVLPGSRSPKATPIQTPPGRTAVDLIKSYDDLNNNQAPSSPTSQAGDEAPLEVSQE